MLSHSALSSTNFPISAGIYRMKLKSETPLMIRNAETMLASSELNLTSSTDTSKVYKDIQYIAPLRETLITDHIEDQIQKAVKKIKTVMARKLRKPANIEELIMIDVIQRSGLEFYFQDNIQAALEKHYERQSSMEAAEDLHDAALRFRLLRQQGYNAPEDCFVKFKSKDGKFIQELEKDIKGLMSLFEASQMHIPGDNILVEAGVFSEHFLRKMKNIEPSQAFIIGNTLRNPCHTSLPKFMSINFLQNFEISIQLLHNLNDESNWIKEMAHLATIDINMAQINHKNEITQVSRWWKGLRLTEELKLARNQPEKWHLWSLACLPSPHMAEQRLELTKAISFVYIIDDIFDVYGTLDELTLFTEAINKWEYANVKGLPNYMKVCLQNIYELINEISNKTYNKHGWNLKEFLQTVWKDLCSSFLVEAKWFASGHIPSTDEYLRNGRITVGVGMVCAHLFLVLGEGANRSNDLWNSYPDIVSLGATIFRLWNDLGTGEDKNENGNDRSFIACHMNEHEGSTTESAQEHVHTMISNSWMCLNEACLQSPPFSAYFKEGVLNLARMAPVMYSHRSSKPLEHA